MGVGRANEELVRMLAMGDEERERYFAALPPDGTSTILVEHLLMKPASPVRDDLVRKARAYWYDDFKTLNPDACPKIALHADLLAAGYPDLAANVVAGIYD